MQGELLMDAFWNTAGVFLGGYCEVLRSFLGRFGGAVTEAAGLASPLFRSAACHILLFHCNEK